MPSVWFINPRIVANLKALATRNRGGGREQEDGRKGRGGTEGREGRRRRRGGGEEAKTRGRESTQDLGR